MTRLFCIFCLGVLSVTVVGCAQRVVTGPSGVPQFQRDFDAKKKQIYIRNGDVNDVVYSNYTAQELESIRTGVPIRINVENATAIDQGDVQWSTVEHTLETDAGFVLVFDANEIEGQQP